MIMSDKDRQIDRQTERGHIQSWMNRKHTDKQTDTYTVMDEQDACRQIDRHIDTYTVMDEQDTFRQTDTQTEKQKIDTCTVMDEYDTCRQIDRHLDTYTVMDEQDTCHGRFPEKTHTQ